MDGDGDGGGGSGNVECVGGRWGELSAVASVASAAGVSCIGGCSGCVELPEGERMPVVTMLPCRSRLAPRRVSVEITLWRVGVSMGLGALSARHSYGLGCGPREGIAHPGSSVRRTLCSDASIAVRKRWGRKLKFALGVLGDRPSSCTARCQGVSERHWGGEKCRLSMPSHGLRRLR